MSRLQQFRNSIAIIKQIKNDEWEFSGHYQCDFKPDFTCYRATRRGVDLWVANGPLFCEIMDQPWQCGPFSILIWYCAARSRKHSLEKQMYRKPQDLTL